MYLGQSNYILDGLKAAVYTITKAYTTQAILLRRWQLQIQNRYIYVYEMS